VPVVDEEKQITIQLQLTELVSKVEAVLEKQDELAENVGKIKEAVYNPDQGLYARLKDMDSRLKEIENWRSNSNKITWLIATSVVGLIVTTIGKAIIS
tara:strand:- start:22 stop:315 length:294 start_codon:yes stop_codon:yes gene_type:complete